MAEALAVLGFFGYALYLGAAALIVSLGSAADRSAPQHAVHGEAGGYCARRRSRGAGSHQPKSNRPAPER